MRSLRIVTDSTGPPVSLTEAKEHLRVLHTDDDSHIQDLVDTATRHAETLTNRSIMPKTYRMTLDDFPAGDVIELPRSPVQSTGTVTVEYLKSSAAGSTNYTTFGATNYVVDSDSEPGRVILKRDQPWPSGVLQNRNAVRVTFDAGYTGTTSVPHTLKAGVLLLTSHLYNVREPVVVGSIASPIPMSAKDLFNGEKVPLLPHD